MDLIKPSDRILSTNTAEYRCSEPAMDMKIGLKKAVLSKRIMHFSFFSCQRKKLLRKNREVKKVEGLQSRSTQELHNTDLL